MAVLFFIAVTSGLLYFGHQQWTTPLRDEPAAPPAPPPATYGGTQA